MHSPTIYLFMSFVLVMGFGHLSIRGNGSKMRYRLKSLLYDLTHSRAPAIKQAGKQEVCRDEAAAACGGKKLFTDQEMFKLLKTAMMFRTNQLSSFDQRFLRSGQKYKYY
eukprot:TRINITY_DN7516_c0_g1_i3.p1 TRINITY_DN7516_c0_g1~~TRINITY_DN7516_c0_g1_i3.p1  ORF type:complete len:110 (-),score=15.73 TRINITY_DN7516_c0_g1_i3:148-477(-)